MRHFRSSREVWSCRLAAWSVILLLLTICSLFLMCGFLPVVVVSGSSGWLVVVAVALAVILAGMVCLVFTSRFHCPLCHGRPLVPSLTQTHRKSRRMFRSCGLHTVSSIIFTSSFRCPYCGECTYVGTK